MSHCNENGAVHHLVDRRPCYHGLLQTMASTTIPSYQYMSLMCTAYAFKIHFLRSMKIIYNHPVQSNKRSNIWGTGVYHKVTVPWNLNNETRHIHL